MYELKDYIKALKLACEKLYSIDCVCHCDCDVEECEWRVGINEDYVHKCMMFNFLEQAKKERLKKI